MKHIFLVIFAFLLLVVPTSSISANHQDCLTAGFWVEDTFYDFFDPNKNRESRNSFEQWSDNQMAQWNRMLKASGVKDCFKIGKIVRVKDGELPLVRDAGQLPTNLPDEKDRSVDVIWGFPGSSIANEAGKKHWGRVLNGIDLALIHELGHARYLIDNYAMNVHVRDEIQVLDPHGDLITGKHLKPIQGTDAYYLSKPQDIMAGNDPFYAKFTATALNLIAGDHTAEKYGNFNGPKNLGVYLNDLPKNNILKILDRHLNAIEGARIRIFQSVDGHRQGAVYSKKIDNIANFEGRTDREGKIAIGSNPFGGQVIDKFGGNTVFLLEILYEDQIFYKFIDVSDFNLAYWQGATEEAIFAIPTTLKTTEDNYYIGAEFSATCGEMHFPLQDVSFKVSGLDRSYELSMTTDYKGQSSFLTYFKDLKPNEKFIIIPGIDSSLGQVTPLSLTITVPNTVGSTYRADAFHFTDCPPAKAIGKILISNYADYRPDNEEGDDGSKSIEVLSFRAGETMRWILPSSSSGNTVYIRYYFIDGNYYDYVVDLPSGGVYRVGELVISTSKTKKIKEIEINGQTISFEEATEKVIKVQLDPDNKTVNLSLFYTNETGTGIGINFESTQNRPQPTPTPISNQPDRPATPTPVVIGNPQTPGSPVAQTPQGCVTGHWDGGETVLCAPSIKRAQCWSDGKILFEFGVGRNAAALTFALRVDDLSNAWQAATHNGDIVVDNIPYGGFSASTYLMSYQPGHRYKWWVHSVNSAGQYTDAAQGGEISCP